MPYGLAPKNAVRIVHKNARGHHCICAVNNADEGDQTLGAEYKALDYRLGGTEAVMAHELRRIPRSAAPRKIVRVLEEDLAESVNKAA